jgi:hypothetical protein
MPNVSTPVRIVSGGTGGGTVAIDQVTPHANEVVVVGGTGQIQLVAGESHVGAIGGNYVSVTMTPTLTTGATYVANDFVGTDDVPITFASVVRLNAGTGRVVDATLYDYVPSSVAAELWLFEATITAPKDSAAWAISDAHSLLCIGIVEFNRYYTSANNSVSNGEMKNGSIGFTCGAGSRSLFGCLVTRGAPAYTNGLVSVRIGVAQD